MTEINQSEFDATTAVSSLDELAGKYLTFCLGDEHYGVDILKVQELIGIMHVTRVPKTSHYMRGVMNLRGKVIPVIDLARKFQLEPQEDTERTCIVVVESEGDDSQITTGIVVDSVSEVIDLKREQLAPPPHYGGDVSASTYIMAMGKTEQHVIMLLDVDKIVPCEESTAG